MEKKHEKKNKSEHHPDWSVPPHLLNQFINQAVETLNNRNITKSMKIVRKPEYQNPQKTCMTVRLICLQRVERTLRQDRPDGGIFVGNRGVIMRFVFCELY